MDYQFLPTTKPCRNTLIGQYNTNFNANMKKLFSLLASFLLAAMVTDAQVAITPANSVKENAPVHLDKPYVILISLDGYRYDYTQRLKPTFISKFIEEGVAAESLIPVFPTKTFSNHYAIATGMYPENNDIVDNTFYDPTRKAVYRMSDREKVEDGGWYKGTPIWVQAAKAGMVTASFFFVGSEADVQGVLPTYYYRYDGAIDNEKRTAQVIEWLKLPPSQRPHLITLYFSDIDSEGHRVGPNNDEALKKVLDSLDQTLGKFFKELQTLQLPINVIVVSDHGMAEIPNDHLINDDLLKDDNRWITVSSGTLVHFYLREGVDKAQVFEELKAKENHFKVFKTNESPYYKANPNNPRNGELLAIADFSYNFSDTRRMALQKGSAEKVTGQHGFPATYREMHGIFYAQGPAFKTGKTIPSFENIHIYPMICKLLELPIPPDVDGDAEVLKPILRMKYRR